MSRHFELSRTGPATWIKPERPLARQSGKVLWDDLAVRASLEFAWERCNAAAAKCAAAGHDLDPHYVMARLADLTIKRVA